MTELLQIYVPKREDGWFHKKMMSDPATMAYNAPWFPPDGCIPNPEAEWDDLQADWIGQEPKRFYAFLRRSSDGAFVGDVNYHYNPEQDWWDMGIVIYAPERGKGYGRQGLRLLADKAFSDGVRRLHNDFETTRDAAYQIHRAVGFREVGRADGLIHLELTEEDFKKPTWKERVSLRPMSAEMYHAYYREYENDPDLFLDKSECKPFVYSPAWVDRYIQRQIDCGRTCLAVMYGEEMAGEIILKNVEPGRSATLSICMKNDRYKGRGIGTQAERLAIDYVFHSLDIPVLYADTVVTNARSQHVLEKLGFQLLRTEGDFKYYVIERESDKKQDDR